MWLDGCKIGLTVESEEGEVPHLRWSQAPPLPWPRPGSADITTPLSHKIVLHLDIPCSPIFQRSDLRFAAAGRVPTQKKGVGGMNLRNQLELLSFPHDTPW